MLAAIYPATWGVAQLVHRRAVRSRRPKVADRRRHVDAGGRHRASSILATQLRGLRGRRRAARGRHRDGLPDAARGDRRRRAPVVARLGGRRVSPLARSRLRDRRAARRDLTADALGLSGAMWLVAAITCLSGVVAAVRHGRNVAALNGVLLNEVNAWPSRVPSISIRSRLRAEIQSIYARVAVDPSGEFHFHRGPEYAARRLGYDADELSKLPGAVTESFAGVGNPHAIAPMPRARRSSTSDAAPARISCLAAFHVGPQDARSAWT